MTARRALIRVILLALLLAIAPVGGAWAQTAGGGLADQRPNPAADRLRNAGPEERRRIRQEMRDRWREAGPEDRERLEQRLQQMQRRMRRDQLQGEGIARERFDRFRREPGEAPGGGMDRRPLPNDARRDLGQKLRDMGPGERAALRQQLRSLPDDEQRALKNRIRDYRSLDDEEQAELRSRLDSLRELPEEERTRMRRNVERWESMSDEEREHMRQQMQRLRGLSIDERIELLDRALEQAPATSEPPGER